MLEVPSILKNTEYGTNFILGGDFNTVLKQDEKRGVLREIHQEDFEDLIMQLNLFDVKPSKFNTLGIIRGQD